jgi:hypothetical protein
MINKDSLENLLFACIYLDNLDRFSHIVNRAHNDHYINNNATESNEEEDEENDESQIFNVFISACYESIRLGKIEFLDVLKIPLYLIYDWSDACYDDYTFDFMELAVKYNRPSVVNYLLTRLDEEGTEYNDACINKYLYRGFSAAVDCKNMQACKYFLNHEKLYLHSSDMNLLLTINDNDLFDKNIDKISILYFWYDSLYAIKCSLDITIINDNKYLTKRVLDLVQIYTKDSKIKNSVIEYINPC